MPLQGVRHSGGGGHVGHQHPGLGGQYPRPQLPSQYRLDELALTALGVTVRQHDHPGAGRFGIAPQRLLKPGDRLGLVLFHAKRS